jgi:uncharacterized protein
MVYKTRLAEPKINQFFEIFPIVSITGPRQSGKSTLIQHYTQRQKENWDYISLDNRETLLNIKEDPTLFAKSIKSNIAIDEAQKAPELFHSLKQIVDQKIPYKIILSGSANFLLLKSITESLAGRVGLIELQPFSLAEAYNLKPNKLISRIIKHLSIDDLHSELIKLEKKQISDEQLLDFILYGGFPKIHELPQKQKWSWFSQYISTYIERDLRDLSQVGNLDAFQKVYKLFAFQTAQILNMSNIASDIGIDSKTVAHYLSILESSYQCQRLNAYYSKQRKQLIKSPKIFYSDTGLVNFHQKNTDIESMLNRGDWGHILETFVCSELHKEIKDMEVPATLNFWRTNNGAEVDFIIEYGRKLYPIEIKTSAQINSTELRGLESFMEAESKKVPFGIVIYRTDKVQFLKKNILGVPLNLVY